jgi:membrane protein DedA with SNARE-associated domain
MLELASVTDSVVTLATHVIRDVGLAGVALLTMTSGVIGMPGSEPTMLFAGFNVYQGHLTMLGIIAFGVLGDVLGAAIAYAIGHFGSRELIERHGGKLHITAERLDRTHRWFERHGSPAIVVSRVIPFIRAAFPFAAGVARMPFGRFVVFTTIGSILWIAPLGFIGRAVGSSWPSWRHNLEYVDYVAAALIAAAVAYVVLRRSRSGRPAPDVAG